MDRKEAEKELLEEFKKDENKEEYIFNLEDLETLKQELRYNYEGIKLVLEKYIDMDEAHRSIVALWIIGTYFHKDFSTYPYLFINAMRGSGKTRLLKIIKELSYNGKLLGSLREAILFRVAKNHTLCIDEFEQLNSKDNASLRELLNASYKKGMTVDRLKKVKIGLSEEYVVEEFEPYTPICMANIFGMTEVLGDRCFTVILEKSDNKDIVNLIEEFDNEPLITAIKANFSNLLKNHLVQLCRCMYLRGCYIGWNNFVKRQHTYTTALTTITTQTTQTTQSCPVEMKVFYAQIKESEIFGRNFELSYPLLALSYLIDETTLFPQTLNTLKEMVHERMLEEHSSSRDVSLIDFIARKGQVDFNFYTIKELTNDFRVYLGEEQDEERWINTYWMGRALKRLSLIIEKRRVARGIEVVLNIPKAQEKIKIFQQTKQ